MDDFNYKDNQLYCENVPLSEIAHAVGTPVYVYSHKTLVDHYKKLDKAFYSTDHLICYSVKSNSNLAVISALAREGSGFDIVSGGELFRVIRAGADPRKVVYAGVGKTAREIEYALNNNILFFTVESFPELEEVNAVAKKLNKIAKIAIRVNPDVDPKTHQYTSTGKAENKFGLDIESAFAAYSKALTLKNIKASALHMHIGSQIVDIKPYQEAIQKIIPFIERLKSIGVELEILDIGGGMGIIYKEEKPSSAEEFANLVLPLIKNLRLKILIEPGRFIAGNAGVLLTKVLYIKANALKNFVIVDAGMNDLIRPSLYGAFHEIIPVKNSSNTGNVVSDVVGPICESGDFFAKDRKMPAVEPEDVLAIRSAGAYGFTMSSQYNSRPKATEVMVKGNQYHIVRKRETYEDLIRGEKIFEG